MSESASNLVRISLQVMKRLHHHHTNNENHQVSAATMGLLADTITRFDSTPTSSSSSSSHNKILLRIIASVFRQIGNMNTTSKRRHRGLRSAAMAASLLSVLCSREDWTEYAGIHLKDSKEIESLTKDLTTCFFDKIEGQPDTLPAFHDLIVSALCSILEISQVAKTHFSSCQTRLCNALENAYQRMIQVRQSEDEDYLDDVSARLDTLFDIITSACAGTNAIFKPTPIFDVLNRLWSVVSSRRKLLRALINLLGPGGDDWNAGQAMLRAGNTGTSLLRKLCDRLSTAKDLIVEALESAASHRACAHALLRTDFIKKSVAMWQSRNRDRKRELARIRIAYSISMCVPDLLGTEREFVSTLAELVQRGDADEVDVEIATHAVAIVARLALCREGKNVVATHGFVALLTRLCEDSSEFDLSHCPPRYVDLFEQSACALWAIIHHHERARAEMRRTGLDLAMFKNLITNFETCRSVKAVRALRSVIELMESY